MSSWQKILCLLLLSFVNTGFLKTATDQTHVYIIETHKALTADESARIKNELKASTLERMTPYRSAYFDRVYRIESSKNLKEGPFEHPIIKTIERPANVESFSNDQDPDPFLSYQWAIQNTGQAVEYDIDDITIGTRLGTKGIDIDLPTFEMKVPRYVRVAVLDYGVDLDHPDLKDSIDINESECVNGQIPLNPKEDKDGNGYIGDCKGWNFTGREKNGSPRQIDDTGHGTHIAGIIAAKRNNGTGIAGVSNQIKILPLKVLSNENERRNAVGFTDRVAQAILYAVERKVDVINLSLGWPLFMDKAHVREAILEAEKQGVLIVAAAGNNSHSAPILPCAMSTVLCVGSINNDGRVSAFSNYGAHVDVLAPGDHILSTIPTAITSRRFSVLGYDYKDGTSQAAPYVAALAALLKAKNGTSSNQTVRDQIIATSRPVPLDEKKFFRAGLISVATAWSNKTKTNLSIELKESNRYLNWSTNSKRGTWEVPIRNHSDNPLTVQLKTRSTNNKGVVFGDVPSVQITARATQTLKIPIQIINQDQESEVIVELTILTNAGTQLQKAHLQLLRDLTDDKDLIKYFLPSEVSYNLYSLKSFGSPTSRPQYYDLQQKDGLTHIQVLQTEEAPTVESLGHFTFENIDRLLMVRTLDVDNSGHSDLQVIALVRENDEQKIVYSHHKLGEGSNHTPFAHMPDWQKLELDLDGVLEVESSLQHVDMTVANQTYKAPYFFSFGPLPLRDQPKNPFERRVTSERLHLYYFVPTQKDNKWVLATRAVNSPDRVKKWGKELNLKAFEDIRFLHLLPTQHEGTLRVLSSIGFDYSRKTFIAHITPINAEDFKITWEPIANSAVVDGFALDDTIHLDANTATTFDEQALIGQVDDRLWTLSRLSSNRMQHHNLRPYDRSEIFNSYIKSYRKKNLHFNFLQTVSEILLITFDDKGNTKKDRTPFHVSTFLPGQVYQERSYPIWFGVKEKSPALYVDSTQIVSRTASLIVARDDGTLTSPMNMSVQVPQRCIANNPSLWNHHEYRFSLTCRNEAEARFELWFLPMK